MKKLILLIVLIFTMSSAFANSKIFPYADHYFVLKSEGYMWQEYYNNEKLLQERGVRFSAGFEYSNLTRRYQGFLFDLGVHGYFGSVYYDGHAQVGSTLYPTTSSTDYIGYKVPALFGYRFSNKESLLTYSVYAGATYDYWMRNIRDTTYGSGNIADGYQEFYHIVAARLAVGISDAHLHDVGRLMLGVKYPFFTRERLSFVTTVLSPGKQASVYAEWTLPLSFVGSDKTQVSVYYESYRFTPSPVVNGVGQPQSQMDALGLSVKF